MFWNIVDVNNDGNNGFRLGCSVSVTIREVSFICSIRTRIALGAFDLQTVGPVHEREVQTVKEASSHTYLKKASCYIS